MDDLISRLALMKEFSDFVRESNNSDFAQTPTWNDAVSLVGSMPSAEPGTAKRIVGKSKDGMTLWYQCDMCNEPVDAQDNFCRGCGRRLVNE